MVTNSVQREQALASAPPTPHTPQGFRGDQMIQARNRGQLAGLTPLLVANRPCTASLPPSALMLELGKYLSKMMGSSEEERAPISGTPQQRPTSSQPTRQPAWQAAQPPNSVHLHEREPPTARVRPQGTSASDLQGNRCSKRSCFRTSVNKTKVACRTR